MSNSKVVITLDYRASEWGRVAEVFCCGYANKPPNSRLESATMKRVDELLAAVDRSTELGVIRYAA